MGPGSSHHTSVDELPALHSLSSLVFVFKGKFCFDHRMLIIIDISNQNLRCFQRRGMFLKTLLQMLSNNYADGSYMFKCLIWTRDV